MMFGVNFLRVIIILSVFVDASVDPQDFYPFGELNGDTVLPRKENQCDFVIMKLPDEDCKLIDTEVYITTNGVVSTNKSVCLFSKGFPSFSQLDKCNNYLTVAPFLLTLSSVAVFETVQFRVTYDADVLQRVNKDISDTGLLSYNPTSALIVTWIGVTFTDYTGDIDSKPKNSFQVVLTSDGYYTFVILNYDKLTWNLGEYNGDFTGITSTGNDVNCSQASGSVSQIGGRLFSSNLLLMSNSSNVNRPGVWIARTNYCQTYKRVSLIKPAYQDMLRHRSLNVVIPESLNCSAEWRLVMKFINMNYFESFCHMTSTSQDTTELSCFGLPFAFDYGSSFPLLFECDSPIEYLNFKFEASIFLTPPVPEVNIKIMNISLIEYSVSIQLKWNAPLIGELNPGCETVNISMHIFDPVLHIWNEPILIMQSVNNSGHLYLKLIEPNTGLFLSKHLLFGVAGNVGLYVINQNTIFSKLFIFDQSNSNPEVKSLRNENVLATVDMMGHRKLNISYRTTPGQDGLGCNFDFGYSEPVTQAIVSSDNQYVTCYVPFLHNYGYMSASLVTSFEKTYISNGSQFEQMGSNKELSRVYKTKTNFNDKLLNFTIDVLPSYPRLTAEQVGNQKVSNVLFKVQVQFIWDPREIPSEYPGLNAFIYQYDNEQNQWMKEMMVSPQDIPPNARSVTLTLSQEAVTVYFNHKVMFGLGYVQGDENFVIFSKMYIPGVST